MTYNTCGDIVLSVPFRIFAFLEDSENSRYENLYSFLLAHLAIGQVSFCHG
jgi:hypothetical protein